MNNYNWKCVIDKPYLNCSKTFPTKQKEIKQLINIAKNDDNIKKIIIFGSTVTPLCNPWSDIDIYYDLFKDIKITKISLESPQDIWSNFMVEKDEDLIKEIKEKGVLVYDRNII